MAQKIAGSQVVSSSQSFTVVFYNLSQTKSNLEAKADSIKQISRKLLDSGDLVGGQADEVRKSIEDIAQVIEKIAATNAKLKGPIDKAIASTATLEHGSKAANAREENKKITANSGVLGKE